MWSMLEERLFAKLRADPELKSRLPQLETGGGGGQAVADARGRGDRKRHEPINWACNMGL